MATEPPPPHYISGFELHRPIGRGRFGEVWLATETDGGERRAVKLLRGDGDTRAVELEGVRQYRRVSENQPNLLQILHLGETDTRSYLVMELADDLRGAADSSMDDYKPKTLAAVMEQREGKRLTPPEALDVTRQILQGLLVLHEAGLVHRDVKPANVLYVGGIVTLGDAGLVSDMGWHLGRSGSFGYLPPDERLDQSRDLYAVGKLLYNMVTGSHPSQFPDLPPGRASDLLKSRDFRVANRLLTKAAHPEAAQGFRSAAEMLGALEKWRRAPMWRRHPAACTSTVVLFLVAAAAGIQGIGSVIRTPAGEPPSVRLHLVSIAKGGREVELRFSDGVTTLASPGGGGFATAAAVDIAGDGHPVLVVGFKAEAAGEYAGAIAGFDPLELRSAGSEPKPVFKESICEDSPAVFEESRGTCDAYVLWKGDLDGAEGDELIVAFAHYRGPAHLVVYGRRWTRLGEYWHFGWPLGSMSQIAPVPLNVDGRRCIAFPMYGNTWAEGTLRAIDDERYHAAILILDAETLLRPVGPESLARFWSVNDWMNRSSDCPPVGYGYSAQSQARTDEVGLLRTMRRFAGGRADLLQLIFESGIELDLDSDLNVLELRHTYPLPTDAPLPSAADVWRRTWPPIAQPRAELRGP